MQQALTQQQAAPSSGNSMFTDGSFMMRAPKGPGGGLGEPCWLYVVSCFHDSAWAYERAQVCDTTACQSSSSEGLKIVVVLAGLCDAADEVPSPH